MSLEKIQVTLGADGVTLTMAEPVFLSPAELDQLAMVLAAMARAMTGQAGAGIEWFPGPLAEPAPVPTPPAVIAYAVNEPDLATPVYGVSDSVTSDSVTVTTTGTTTSGVKPRRPAGRGPMMYYGIREP